MINLHVGLEIENILHFKWVKSATFCRQHLKKIQVSLLKSDPKIDLRLKWLQVLILDDTFLSYGYVFGESKNGWFVYVFDSLSVVLDLLCVILLK